MPNSTIAPVVGNDNVAPLYNPDNRWQVWNRSDIYIGTTGTRKYVPNVGDEVHEIIGAVITRYVVASIDPVTFIAVLQQENVTTITQAMSDNDILLGVGPGTQSDTYRVYVDKTVTPHRMSVDARLVIRGSNANVCKIFRNTNVSGTGVVISAIYNSSGLLLSENVPLEIVSTTVLNNTAAKVVSVCYTSFDLQDGEVVTAVFYDTAGFVVSKRQLLIENTGFIRTTDASLKYVSHIALESAFLSGANSRLIQYPQNVALSAANFIGVVYYSDGSSTRLAVDGTRFAIAGLDSYAATIVGQKSQVVLKYALGVGELSYGNYSSSMNHVSEIYDIETIATAGNYAVQLYPVPVWQDLTSGYRLEWYLFDLNRSIYYNVTTNVVVGVNSTSFNPTLYGSKQTFTVSINLNQVNGSYSSFVQVQNVDIYLNKTGISRPNLDGVPNWKLSNISGQSPVYGQGVQATFYRSSGATWDVRIDTGALSLAAWLDKVYFTTNPLKDLFRETAAPTPTHFILTIGGVSQTHPVSDWNMLIQFTSAVLNNSNIYIRFINRTSTTDLQLGLASMQVFQIDINGNYI